MGILNYNDPNETNVGFHTIPGIQSGINNSILANLGQSSFASNVTSHARELALAGAGGKGGRY